MDWLNGLCRRFAVLFRRDRADSELAEELQCHLELQAEEYQERGMGSERAACAARRQLGNMTRWHEDSRDVWGWGALDRLAQDINLAFRTVRRQPGFALAVILVIALGVGATATMLAVVRTALLVPLPYGDPDRLVAIWEKHQYQGLSEVEFAPANFVDLEASGSSWDGIAAHTETTLDLTGISDPEQLVGRYVTPEFFQIIGTNALIGRAFAATDKGAEIVLSYALWQRKFGGDPNIVGRGLVLNGRTLQVVGVMPGTFRFPTARDEFWVPIRLSAEQSHQRSNHYLEVVGRLKKGHTADEAQAEADVIARRLETSYPHTNGGVGFHLVPLQEQLVKGVRLALLVLLAATGAVLLIACANVANLTLNRSLARQKDIALRAALGAGRVRLIRHLLTESLLLASLGGAAAIPAAMCGLGAVTRLFEDSALLGTIRLDASAFAITFAVALISGVAFGTVPALVVTSRSAMRYLKAGSRAAGEASKQVRLRRLLVCCELALTLVLLTGAGLLLKSFARLLEVSPGFRPDNLLTLRISPPRLTDAQHSQRVAYFRRVLEQIKALPGVQNAAAITWLPFSMKGGSSWFTVEGPAPAAHPEELVASNRLVTAGYFQTMGMPLRRGRLIEETDLADAPRVAVINETMARRFWPGQDPVGKRFKFGIYDDDRPWILVVGIVGDVRQTGLEAAVAPEIYRPFAQDPQGWLIPHDIAVRTTSEPLTLVRSVREAIWSVDRQVPVFGVASGEQLVSESLAWRRVILLLTGSFAGFALLLAAVGVYGVVAYAVTQRRREVAIRLALGGQRLTVAKTVMAAQLAPVFAGVAVGVVAALAVGRFLAGLLYSISSTDPATLVLVTAFLAAIAASAAYVPTRRVLRINPTEALRDE